LKNLKLVAVDELHYYSALFGRYAVLKSEVILFHLVAQNHRQPRRFDHATPAPNMHSDWQ
jgi:hypothetical protein